MHENKFEKQVKEKMDQLGFDPSEAVWTEVDRVINSEKKRRSPIFWIFFLSGLVIAGGTTYMLMNLSHKEFSQTVNLEKKESQKVNLKKKESQKVNLEKKAPDPDKQAPETSAINRHGNLGSPALIANPLPLIKVKSIGTNKTGLVGDKTVHPSATTLSPDSNTLNTVKPKVTPAEEEKLNNTLPADSISDSKTAEVKNRKTNKSPWSFAFTGGLGVSDINQSLFKSLDPSNLSYAAYTPANTPATGPPATINIPSETRAGFSFAIGMSVKRNLSKRISASAGLVYHYYSTSNNTGISVDSSLVVYSYFAQASSVNSFYRNGEGKEFTNQYHFIELPVNLGFQLNKSLRNPVKWEAGFSLAWLVSANALQFDPYTNVYFKNNQLFNRIQWGAATAILIGFPVNDHSIQLGPQIQYSLTSLLKQNSSNPGHLIYFGLKFSFNR